MGSDGPNKNYFVLRKISTLRAVGDRKCGTRALVFSLTMAHGNSKDEIRHTEECKKRRVEKCVWKK